MKKILVVYSWSGKKGSGFGNVDCTCEYNTPNIENIREMEKQIQEKHNLDHVVVLNIINLEDEETEGEDER